jgi:hypothetical protein
MKVNTICSKCEFSYTISISSISANLFCSIPIDNELYHFHKRYITNDFSPPTECPYLLEHTLSMNKPIDICKKCSFCISDKPLHLFNEPENECYYSMCVVPSESFDYEQRYITFKKNNTITHYLFEIPTECPYLLEHTLREEKS